MPYTPQQKRDHIRELQRMLYGLSHYDERIPSVIPDEIYGRETAQAVRAFQQANNLHPTGETNRATWDAIAVAYLEIVARTAKPLDVFPHDKRTLSPGDQGLPVLVLQSMLQHLSTIFDNFRSIPITGQYDMETRRAVQEFQSRSGQSQTGSTDPATWNLLIATATHPDTP
ncbi:MAG: peptidoglycan-binding protein [Ruminococcus sp.]|nr:peptidoglycan-binding protein [Ruminococcus sp.]